MHILVLDTIHGGRVIADHLHSLGHTVDMIDVYRHSEGISSKDAFKKRYDLVTAPIHLDPDYPLLKYLHAPTISHHELVRWIFSGEKKGTIVEITGKQGKSTTAYALASLMEGPGVVQSSSGLFKYPEQTILGKYSITPASLLTAQAFLPDTGWMIAEISLGFCGIGKLGILTSDLDYPIAQGKRSALMQKIESTHLMEQILLPPNLDVVHDTCIHVGDLVQVEGTMARYSYKQRNGSFTNPLLLLPGYRTPLMLACAAALILDMDPSPLGRLQALPGRMDVKKEGRHLIIDNSNSGTDHDTTCDAFRYGTEIAGAVPVTLVIGQESASVCENFKTDDICSAIEDIHPNQVILIPGDKRIKCDIVTVLCANAGIRCTYAVSYDDALTQAQSFDNPLILLSVKRWK